MTYSGRLGDWYTGLGARVWAQKHSVFFFSVVFQQRIHRSGDQRFDNATIYFEMAWKPKMQREEKNNQTIRGRKDTKNCLPKSFHSFKYVIDHANVRFFFYINCLHRFVWFLLYCFLHFLRWFRSSHNCIAL